MAGVLNMLRKIVESMIVAGMACGFGA